MRNGAQMIFETLITNIWKNKYFRFLIVGGVNALLYSVFLVCFIEITEDYYLSVGFSQFLMAIIGYINFSFFSFNHKIGLNKFLKFCLSNIFLFTVSSGLVFILTPLGISSPLFALINVLIIAPLSYIINSRFVFSGNDLKINSNSFQFSTKNTYEYF